MFSASPEDFGSAVEELSGQFSGQSGPRSRGRLAVERLGPDVGVLPVDGPSAAEVARACREAPLVFVRHLTTERYRLEPDEAAGPALADAAAGAVAGLVTPGTPEVAAGAVVGVAVQSWLSGEADPGFTAGDAYARVVRRLRDDGLTVARSGQEHTVSLCLTATTVSVAVNRTADSLADWPGGRVRLARPAEQLARSEFKLEEALHLFRPDLPVRGRALDLGASPGGWTRILRRHGLEVWAVDPGELAPAVASDPGVHHVRTTSGEFLRQAGPAFDVVVNDMKMAPELTCTVMNDAAARLTPGALAVLTLKTGPTGGVDSVRRSLAVLRREYDVLHARQLHHNRREVTVLARLRAG